MAPDLMVTIGTAVCGISIFCAVIAAFLLRLSRRRLDKQLDAEFGKRRR